MWKQSQGVAHHSRICVFVFSDELVLAKAENQPCRTSRRSEPLIAAISEINVPRSRFGGLERSAKK
jgi:hypothetical protein